MLPRPGGWSDRLPKEAQMTGRRRTALATATLTLALALIAGPALASPPPRHTGKLAVGVQVLRFSAGGRTIRARGLVTARLTDNAGHSTVLRQRVNLSAKTGGGCRVLNLVLDKLSLKLLGLNADLDKVVLNVTGKRKGGVLGKLFCRLARAKVSRARSSALRALNAGVRKSGRAVRFTATLNGQSTTRQVRTCQVLDLVVGPLNLNLLGLVVDLQRLHLAVTATRGAGKLGDLFCQLADQ
jgi:hypothetical protein